MATRTRIRTLGQSLIQNQIRNHPTQSPLSTRGTATAGHPHPHLHVVTGTEAQTIAVTIAETLDAPGMTVATETILGLHCGALPRHPRGTVTIARQVDAAHRLTVAVRHPLPGPGMTAGATGIGTWIGAGGMTRVTVTKGTRGERMGNEWTRRKGIMVPGGDEGREGLYCPAVIALFHFCNKCPLVYLDVR
ncbi:hypothetical protein L210DRAFT_534884 [Boletus edulis BED1]|uniref:Uncharacterized protein n=1 Tax=Boletus edulis BED1 TaxID=1328754 RepID=A0AAD4BK99_BOLED|nr:hypothetical protein L210DRAFT_534884 [Boletus edulis BED1]